MERYNLLENVGEVTNYIETEEVLLELADVRNLLGGFQIKVKDHNSNILLRFESLDSLKMLSENLIHFINKLDN